MKPPPHMSFKECALPFWWRGIPASEMHRCAEYMGVQDVVSDVPPITNVATNSSHLLLDEVGYGDRLSGNGLR